MADNSVAFILHNLRSAHNVGSILRSADGFGIDRIYLTGYTPYPKINGDPRLPHLAQKIHNQIAKTALGAEDSVKIARQEDIFQLIKKLKTKGYMVLALEQDTRSTPISKSRPGKLAVIVGREVQGIEAAILDQVDQIIEIPMQGAKESLNVAVAAAIMMYVLRTQ